MYWFPDTSYKVLFMAMSFSPKPRSLTEWAYLSIKEQILDNKITTGSQLNIEELAKEMNISRTPIREALLRLKQNGLVVSAANVGFFVCGITKRDFDDIFELRQLIESYAVVKYVEKSNEDDTQALINLHEQCKLEAEAGNAKVFNSYDVQLHDTIINSVGNRKMLAIYSDVADLLYRLRVYAAKSSENIRQSLNEHEKIICAIKVKDSTLARLVMEEHILNIRARLEKIVEFEDES